MFLKSYYLIYNLINFNQFYFISFLCISVKLLNVKKIVPISNLYSDVIKHLFLLHNLILHHQKYYLEFFIKVIFAKQLISHPHYYLFKVLLILIIHVIFSFLIIHTFKKFKGVLMISSHFYFYSPITHSNYVSLSIMIYHS